MDKNKFWLGGRLFNTASPRLGAPTQRKARPQDGRPNATQGTSASWAPQCNARHVKRKARPQCKASPHVRKLGATTQRKALPQDGRPNAKLIRNENSSATQTQGMSARPQVGCPNATKGTSARWSPKHKTNPQRKRPHKGALG
jgi:hypothetical protein